MWRIFWKNDFGIVYRAGGGLLILSFFFKVGAQKKFEMLYQSLPPHFDFYWSEIPKHTLFLISNEYHWDLRLPGFSVKLSRRPAMRTFPRHVQVSRSWDESTGTAIRGHHPACLAGAAMSSHAPLSKPAVLCPQACCSQDHTRPGCSGLPRGISGIPALHDKKVDDVPAALWVLRLNLMQKFPYLGHLAQEAGWRTRQLESPWRSRGRRSRSISTRSSSSWDYGSRTKRTEKEIYKFPEILNTHGFLLWALSKTDCLFLFKKIRPKNCPCALQIT